MQDYFSFIQELQQRGIEFDLSDKEKAGIRGLVKDSIESEAGIRELMDLFVHDLEHHDHTLELLESVIFIRCEDRDLIEQAEKLSQHEQEFYSTGVIPPLSEDLKEAALKVLTSKLYLKMVLEDIKIRQQLEDSWNAG